MPNNILITPGKSSIQFSGSLVNSIELLTDATGSVTFYGYGTGSKAIVTIYDTSSGYLGINQVKPSASLHINSPSGGFATLFTTATATAFAISSTTNNVMIGKAVDDGINALQIVGSVSASAFTGSFSGGVTGSFTGSVLATGSFTGSFAGQVTSAVANLSGSLTGSFRGLSSGSFSSL